MTTADNNAKIGFTCAYAPVSIIHAAGFTPYRVLPLGETVDQAGLMLHDNLCPHIKRILDRALGNDIPDLAGMVFINSCDAMRRLCDAWQKSRPQDKVILLDLPTTSDPIAVSFFAQELERLFHTLIEWTGQDIAIEKISHSLSLYNQIADTFQQIRQLYRQGQAEFGFDRIQELYNAASTQSPEEMLIELKKVIDSSKNLNQSPKGIPVYLFGNVLPDPKAYELIEQCGAFIADDDLCTGSRMFAQVRPDQNQNVFHQIAMHLLKKPACARTLDPARPFGLARDIVANAKSVKAKGAICHVMKFCDPYLSRIPTIRDILREQNIPMLVLEGDCTLRSMGQQRTRIEAFIEMLG